MLLNEIFGGMPLFENSATVQVVVNHLRDMLPDVRAIWLYRENARAPWQFTAVVSDQIAGEEFNDAKQGVNRIRNAIKGLDLRFEVVIESAFEQKEGAVRVYTRPPLAEAEQPDYRAMGRQDARARIPTGSAGLGPSASDEAQRLYWEGYNEEREATRNDPMNVPVRYRR